MATRPTKPNPASAAPNVADPVPGWPTDPATTTIDRRQHLEPIDVAESHSALESAAQLPQTLPGRELIYRLLVSLHIPSASLYPTVARAVAGVLDRVTWLAETFGPDASRIKRGLKVLAPPSSDRWPNFTDARGIEPLRALNQGLNGSDPDLDPLLALLVAGAALSSPDQPSTPQWREIKTLSIAIYQVAERKRQQLRAKLAVLRPGHSFIDVLQIMDSIWEVGRDHLSLDWRRAWSPWLRNRPSVIPPTRDPKRSANDRRLPRGSAPRDSEPTPIEIPAPDTDLGDDSEAEVSTVFLFAKPRIRSRSEPKATRASRNASALGSLYQRNGDLLNDHIEVLTESEVVPLLEVAEEDLQGLGSATGRRALCALSLRMALESSLNPEVLLGARLLSDAPSGSALMLDLAAGDLLFSVLDPGVRKCAPGTEALFDRNADYVRQPLSDGLVSALRKVFTTNAGAACLNECAEAPSWPSVNEYLWDAADRAGLDPKRCTLVRFLRVAAVRIQDFAVDRPATMLSTKDSSGASTAPLHYYSPQQTRLDELYRRAIWSLFSACPAVERTCVDRNARVGPARVVTVELARKAVQAMSNRLNVAIARNDAMSCIGLHNTFCNYVLNYFLIISSHRLEKALFTLTRKSFDLANCICIIEDKKVDPAHWPRLVALTQKFTQQLWLFLDHLRELSKCTWVSAGTRKTLNEMLEGDAPIFRHLNAEGDILPPDAAWWSSTLPKMLIGAPDNWHRVFLSNHLREHDVDGTSVEAQLGHLSAAGFPFGRESVLAPLDIAAAIRKGLKSLEKDLRFEVRAGLSLRSVRTTTLVPVCTLALRDWDNEQAVRVDALRVLQEKNRVHLGSKLKEKRRSADDWLRATAHEVEEWFPRLVALILSGTKAKDIPEDLRGKFLPSASLGNLVQAIDRDHASDESTRIAVWNRLSSLLHWSSRKIGMRCDDIGRIFPATHGPISPFMVGHGLIAEQAEALRRCLPRVPKAWLPLPDHVRRALGMMLFGGPIHPRDIYRLATESTHHFKPTAPGAVLIGADNRLGGPRQALIGHASMAFFYKSDDPTPNSLTYESFCNEVSAVFKGDFVGRPGTETFERICKTLDLARDVEISGFGRALYRPSGAKELSPTLQLAFLNEQRPVRSILNKVEGPDEYPEPKEGKIAPIGSTNHGNAPASQRKKPTPQYDKDRLLLALRDPLEIIRAEVEGDAPHSARHDAKSDSVPSREKCAEAVRLLMSKRPRDHSIVQALYDFTLEQLVNGTRQKIDPLPVTIYAYVTSIAADLLSLFDRESLVDLSIEDYEDAFTAIIENAESEASQKRKAEQLRELHRFLTVSDHWRLEPIDDELFDPFLDAVDSRPEANLVTRPEIEMALRWLINQSDPSMPGPSVQTAKWRRRGRLAAALLTILAGAGSRISEIAWLRHRDLLVLPGDIVVFLRPSRFRRIKTGAGERLLRLSSVLDKEALSFVRSIIEEERARLPDSTSLSAFFFADADSPKVCVGSPALRKLIQIAFKQGAGCDMWPHLLRHSRANSGVLKIFDEMETSLDIGQNLRRSKQLAADIGHRSLSTTGRHYFHLPAITHQLARDLRRRRDNRIFLAILTGREVRAVDAQYRRACSDFPELAGQWCHALTCRRSSDPTTAPPVELGRFVPPHRPLTFESFRALLRASSSQADIIVRGGPLGLSRGSASLIWNACTQVHRDTDYALVPLPTSRGKISRAPSPRVIDPKLEEGLLQTKLFATSPPLIDLLSSCYSPSQARLDQMRGPIREIQSLHAICATLGVQSGEIAVTTTDDATAILKIRGKGKVSPFHQLVEGLMALACFSLCLEV